MILFGDLVLDVVLLVMDRQSKNEIHCIISNLERTGDLVLDISDHDLELLLDMERLGERLRLRL